MNLKLLRITSRFHPPHPWLRDPSRSELIRRFHGVGGMQLQVHLLTKAVSQLGVSQTVITVRPPWTDRHEESPNLSIHRYGWGIASPRQMYAIPAMRHILRLRPKSFDLIHCHSAQDIAAIPLAIMAANRVNAPLILSLHSSWQHTYIPDTVYGAVRQRIGQRIEKQGLKHASTVIVLTNRMASLLVGERGMASEKIFVLPDAVDLNFMRSAPSIDSISHFHARFNKLGDRPRVTFIGRLVSQKGVAYLIEAFSKLQSLGMKASLVIVGDGPKYNEIKQAVSRMGLDRCTTFTRFVHHDDIPLLLAETDVLVIPSIYEEFGSVLLEGMAAGVPIVASDVDGIPSTIQHERNGLLTPPRDADSIAEAIRQLLMDRSLAYKLGRQASLDAERFHVEQVAKVLLNDVYLKYFQ